MQTTMKRKSYSTVHSSGQKGFKPWFLNCKLRDVQLNDHMTLVCIKKQYIIRPGIFFCGWWEKTDIFLIGWQLNHWLTPVNVANTWAAMRNHYHPNRMFLLLVFVALGFQISQERVVLPSLQVGVGGQKIQCGSRRFQMSQQMKFTAVDQ